MNTLPSSSRTPAGTLTGRDPVASALGALRQGWQSRPPRERRLLVGAAMLIALTLIVTLADWLRAERGRLDRALPRMQVRMEQMQLAASEIAHLRAQQVPTAPQLSAQARIEAVTASARSRGLNLNIQSSSDGVHIRGNAAFDPLLEWLASLHHDQGLRVQRMEIQRAGAEASVEIALVARSGR